MEKGLFGLEKGSFAEGLASFNTKGANVIPVRLNKRMKEILFQMITESFENTSILFDDDELGNDVFDRFMRSMEWIRQELTRDNRYNVKLTKPVACVVHFWMSDNKYHELSNEPDFDKAMQWLTNKINTKYAYGELTLWKANET